MLVLHHAIGIQCKVRADIVEDRIVIHSVGKVGGDELIHQLRIEMQSQLTGEVKLLLVVGVVAILSNEGDEVTHLLRKHLTERTLMELLILLWDRRHVDRVDVVAFI